MSEIKLLFVSPMEKPKEMTVLNTLDTLQELVGGFVQDVYPWSDPVCILCDEEGKYNGRMPNRLLRDEDGKPYDIINGSFLICGISGDDFVSLSDDLSASYMKKFEIPEFFFRNEKGVFCVKMEEGSEPEKIA